MNIQIFGTSKCFDTKKAQRYFKERGIKFQMIDLKENEMSRASSRTWPALLAAGKRLVDPECEGQADPCTSGRTGGLAEGGQAV
mgnify:CR=1 FL=1